MPAETTPGRIIGVLQVLLGIPVLSGRVLPWTSIIAVALILIGIGLIVKGFGRMG